MQQVHVGVWGMVVPTKVLKLLYDLVAIRPTDYVHFCLGRYTCNILNLIYPMPSKILVTAVIPDCCILDMS